MLGHSATVPPSAPFRLVGTSDLIASGTVLAGSIIANVPSLLPQVKDVVTDSGLIVGHSCDPGAVLLDGRIVAMRDIPPGAPVTVNYNWLFETDAVEECHCGAKNCDGKVGAFSAMPTARREAFLQCIDPEIRRRAVDTGLVTIPSDSPDIVLRHHPMLGDTAYAKRPIKPGTVVYVCTGFIIPFPNIYTLCLDRDVHLIFQCDAQCLAHSCNPNVAIRMHKDKRGFDMVAIRSIETDEAACFNYLKTEWEMRAPFACHCGAPNCYGTIRGFKFLDPDAQRALLPEASPYVREMAIEANPALAAPPVEAALQPEVPAVRKPRKEIVVRRLVRTSELLINEPFVPAGTVVANATASSAVDVVTDTGLIVGHSCEPNAVLLEGRVVTLCDVWLGSLVTVNYNWLFESSAVEECHCGAKTCDGFVGAFSVMPRTKRELDLQFIDPEVRRRAIESDVVAIPCNSEEVELRTGQYPGSTTFAKLPVKAGSVVFKCKTFTLPFPTLYTLCVGNRHMLIPCDAQCLAHSCDPNVEIRTGDDMRSLDVVAVRDIGVGDIIAFNYLTTEWEMQVSFPCRCGAKNCYGIIRGFKFLPGNQQRALLPHASAYVREMAIEANPALVTPPVEAAPQLEVPSMPKKESGMFRLVGTSELLINEPFAPAGTVVANATASSAVDVVTDTGLIVGHSCEPNAVLLEKRLVALKDLRKGAPVTVNYNWLFETALVEECHCGAKNCDGKVGAFSAMPAARREAFLQCIDPEIRRRAVDTGLVTIPSGSPDIVLRHHPMLGDTTYAKRPIKPGTVVFVCNGVVIPFANIFTVCLDRDVHLIFQCDAQCLAHSCNPNVVIRVNPAAKAFNVVALRNIETDEAVSFNYLTTEWEMRAPFACHCGAPNCYGTIRGFKFLDPDAQRALLPEASPYVREMAIEANPALATPPVEAARQPEVPAVRKPRKEIVVRRLVRTSELLINEPFVPAGTVVASATASSAVDVVTDTGLIVGHSCEPNAFLLEGRIITLSCLWLGSLVTVNYNWLFESSAVEECHCGAKTCDGFVGAFSGVAEGRRGPLLQFIDPEVRHRALHDGAVTLKSSSPDIDIRPTQFIGDAGFAKHVILPGTVLFHCIGFIIPFPTYYTVCLDRDVHLIFQCDAQCLAHSCNPNVAIRMHKDKRGFDMVAIRRVEKDEVCAFNYLTTEWELQCPFACHCGAPNCYGTIRGFKFLDPDAQRALLPEASPYVRETALQATPTKPRGIYRDTQ